MTALEVETNQRILRSAHAAIPRDRHLRRRVAPMRDRRIRLRFQRATSPGSMAAGRSPGDKPGEAAILAYMGQVTVCASRCRDRV